MQEGEQDQTDSYKELQLHAEILFPHLTFLPVTLHCPNSGVRPDLGKEQGGLDLALGINLVPEHLFGKELQKCVHCIHCPSKRMQFHQFVQEFISHPSTPEVQKELIYSIPQQWEKWESTYMLH